MATKLARRIRADSRTIATLTLDRADRLGPGGGQEPAAEAGFDEHLTKPVDPDDLSRIINFKKSAAA